ncbi:MAG: hypothetical protein ABIR58_07340 [Gemmatimonadaceae bacterium]
MGNKPATPKSPRNPFVIGHHAEGAGFADRDEETRRIEQAFSDPGSRLLVYGDRRLGKSSTIRVAADRARKSGHKVAIVDLAHANSAAAAAQRILSTIHKEIGGEWKDFAIRAASRLKGTFSITPGMDSSGNTTLAFSLTPTSPDRTEPPTGGAIFFETLDAVEAELAKRKLNIGLDEFQRLRRWAGADVDWPLKEMLERHRNIAYVLAGSERTMVEQMLANKKAGLWKVVEILDMSPIDPVLFARWVLQRARDTGLVVDVVTAAAIVRLGGPRTRDVVQLARSVWEASRAKGSADKRDVVRALEILVGEQAALHRRAWELLPHVARRILMVVAAEPSAQLTSASALSRFGLGSKSTVHREAANLVDEEILVRTPDGIHDFDDPFFRRWVQLNVIEDINRQPPSLLD